LEETKVISGWLIDFHGLLIILPDNKFKAWTAAIETTINNGTATARTLETNIGRLVHLRMATSFVHHFMSHLRDLHSTAKQRRLVKINGEHTKDLLLMLEFLRMANNGISLNTFTDPILVQQDLTDTATRDLHGIGTSQTI
jgi:hypothetical protein